MSAIKLIPTITIVLISLGIASAQNGLYTGGAGDGYAMGELTLRQVGVAELELQIQVYPTLAIAGQPVIISTDITMPISWQLTDVSGRQVGTGNFDDNHTVSTAGLPGGLYLLQLTCNGGRAIYKINLVE